MDQIQTIRAAAAQAAATLMAPMQPLPADFVVVAEVIEAYIRDGREAAFALCPPEAGQQPEIAQSEPAPAPVIQDAIPAPAPAAEPEPERTADVIPLEARGKVSPKQEGARRIIEKHRKERVDSLLAQATVAKVKAHKQRLYDEAEESDLLDYSLVMNNEPTTLGAYLGSLLGS